MGHSIHCVTTGHLTPRRPPSGTFSHATRGRRGKFGTPESRLTKFNTHHCFYRHFTSAHQLFPDSPACGGEGKSAVAGMTGGAEIPYATVFGVCLDLSGLAP